MRDVYAFDYIDVPYPVVRDALRDDPASLFESGASGAEERIDEILSSLDASIGGVEVSRPVVVELGRFQEVEHPLAVCRRAVRWRSVGAERLFPAMEGELEAYPLSARETQISFIGAYDPPLGPLGELLDTVALHRVAEASIHRFIDRVGAALRERVAAG